MHSSHTYYSGSHFDNVQVNSMVGYLGQYNTSAKNTIMKSFEIPRFYSFAPEPSALILFFLITSALALSYPGIYKLLGILQIFCVVFLTSSGTAFLSIGIAIQLYIFLFIIKKVRGNRLLTTLFLLITLIIQASIFLNTSSYSFISNYTQSFTKISTILVSQSDSYFIRTRGIISSFGTIFQNPFGVLNYKSTATGTVVSIGISYGIIGMFIILGIYTRIFVKYIKVFFYSTHTRIMISSAIILGALFQSSFFSGYEWNSGGGFIMLLLLQLRGDQFLNERQLKQS